jgi:hypothetical protein
MELEQKDPLEIIKAGCGWGILGGIGIGAVYFVLYIAYTQIVNPAPTEPLWRSPFLSLLCLVTIIVMGFGAIVGLVMGSIGGLVFAILVSFLSTTGLATKVYRWVVGIVAAFFGFGGISVIFRVLGLLDPCLLADEPLCINTTIEFRTFLFVLYIPAGMAATWSVIASQKLLHNQENKVSGVTQNV